MSALVLWRHAPTADNAAERLQGQRDTPLSAQGKSVAGWAARTLLAEFGREVRVVSSPLIRALDTAKALTELIGTQPEVNEDLKQRSYGEWEGLTWEQIRATYPRQAEQHAAGANPAIEGWDSQEQVAERIHRALERMWDPTRVTVLVSHGGPIGLGIHSLLGLPLSPRVVASLPHGAWAVVRKAGGGSWQLDAFGVGAD